MLPSVSLSSIHKIFLLVAIIASGSLQAQTPVNVSVSVDPGSVVMPIPPDFQALRMGINYAPKNSNSGYYFNVTNQISQSGAKYYSCR